VRDYRQTDFYKQLGYQLGIEDEESVCPVSKNEERLCGKMEHPEKTKQTREEGKQTRENDE
tara:strand:- start:243 stop:425 length:183 start_codon:yes stop_codon:yes gene_type:complete